MLISLLLFAVQVEVITASCLLETAPSHLVHQSLDQILDPGVELLLEVFLFSLVPHVFSEQEVLEDMF